MAQRSLEVPWDPEATPQEAMHQTSTRGKLSDYGSMKTDAIPTSNWGPFGSSLKMWL
jgi:hypothetical protein